MARFFGGWPVFWLDFPFFFFPAGFWRLPDAHLSSWSAILRKKSPSSEVNRPARDRGRHLRSGEPIFLRDSSSWLAKRCGTVISPQVGASLQGTHEYDEILGAAAASA